jgi:pimeloyl-ACP methyl ester carboxylesterase
VQHIFAIRNLARTKAIVFVHGLLEDVMVWSRFAGLLKEDPQFAEWDLFSVGWHSTLAPELWSDESSLSNQADLLYEAFVLSPVAAYEQVAFIAHSAGGLLVQKLLVGFDDVLQRVSHVFLFGTPSQGSRRSRSFRRWKTQWRDLAPGSRFIAGLRASWSRKFDRGYPFNLDVIVGRDDSTARPASVRGPFSQTRLWVVPGDHEPMIQPSSAEDTAFQIVKKGLDKPRPHAAAFEPSAYTGRTDVFVSYSHQDFNWWLSLGNVLSPVLGANASQRVWSDLDIEAGAAWEETIVNVLRDAAAGILLVSNAFLESKFIGQIELPALLSRDILLLCVRLETIDAGLLSANARSHYESLRTRQFVNAKTPLKSCEGASVGTELVTIARTIKERIVRP